MDRKLLNFSTENLQFDKLLLAQNFTEDMKETGIEKLAWLGDAVYELYVRVAIFHKAQISRNLHVFNVKLVNAAFQAALLRSLIESGFLTPDEEKFVKRARNYRSHSQAKNQDPLDYRYATALEALIGLLYCERKVDRIQEIIAKIAEMKL